jgi:hypothetical protein
MFTVNFGYLFAADHEAALFVAVNEWSSNGIHTTFI